MLVLTLKLRPNANLHNCSVQKTRLDTRLPMSRAGGQAGYGKVPEHASIARRQKSIFVGRREKYM